jgi:hypothetical protein
MGLKCCSYCLASGPLENYSGLGELCEICIDSYFEDILENWLQSQKQQKAIKPLATMEGIQNVKNNHSINTLH